MPSLSITAARITEPAVGALVWASGSHVCTGNSGTFTANASPKAKNSQRAVLVASSWFSAIASRSKVTSPPAADECRKASATMATSIKAEPNMVNRKNFVAA